MKNVFKSFALLLCISLIFGSCSDSVTVSEDQDINLKAPLPDNHNMSDIISDDFKINLVNDYVLREEIKTRSNCPALYYAEDQLEEVIDDCGNSAYCQYLALFWDIDISIAGVNCGISGFCTACEYHPDNFEISKNNLPSNTHPVYIQSITQKIASLVNACNANNCP